MRGLGFRVWGLGLRGGGVKSDRILHVKRDAPEGMMQSYFSLGNGDL